MSIVISGILVIATFLLASTEVFSIFLATSESRAQSLKALTDTNKEQTGSALNITSAAVDTPGGSNMTLQVSNTGSQSVANFGQMDVIVRYTDPSSNLVLTYLAYNALSAGDNQWTVPVTGVQPDSFNPRFWDSDEVLTIKLKVAPAVKAGTPALAVVATPWGVSDQTSVTNP